VDHHGEVKIMVMKQLRIGTKAQQTIPHRETDTTIEKKRSGGSKIN
jgi:hypothetical protein